MSVPSVHSSSDYRALLADFWSEYFVGNELIQSGGPGQKLKPNSRNTEFLTRDFSALKLLENNTCANHN